MLKKGFQFITLLCALVLLCNLFCKGKQETNVAQQKLSSTAGFVVQVEEEKGSFFYDPEELLPRMVLAVLPVSKEELYTPELLKAMFIVCRTNLWDYWQQDKKDVISLTLENSPLPLLSEAAYRQLFEKQIPKKRRNDILAAQEATKGIILSFQGEVIQAPFFYLSMGMTRSAEELFSDDYAYLRARDCSSDKQHEDYLQQSIWEQGAFFQKLMSLFVGEKQAEEMLENNTLTWADFEVMTTKSGYLTSITYIPEQMRIDADCFQEAFGLASGCVTIEERENSIVLHSKGVGHGFGLSICYAASLAEQGQGYEEILHYFYENISLERKYNVYYEQ